MKRFNQTPDLSITIHSGGELKGRISESWYIEGRISYLNKTGIGLFTTKEILEKIPSYLYPVVQDGKIGFINSFADVVIPLQYDEFIGEFSSSDSLITVCKEGKWGILNANGIEMLMGEYQSISLIDTQYAIVMNSERQKGIIEIMTKKTTVPFGEYNDLSYYGSLLRASNKQFKGLITPTGKRITPIQYKWIGDVEYGLIRVIIEEKIGEEVIQKWGMIDTQGREILPAIYDNISRIKYGSTTIYAHKDHRCIKFDIENLTKKFGIYNNSESK